MSRVANTFKKLLKARVTTGLITILPIYVTWVIVRFLFELMRDSSQWVVYGVLDGGWVKYMPDALGITWEGIHGEQLKNPAIQWTIAVASVFLTVGLLYAVGLFAAHFLGRRVIDAMERILDRVPLVKTVYRSCKKILVTFGGEQETNFQRVALVPFPEPNCRSIGFVTGVARDAKSGDELCTCFIATTPNPTTGFVFVVRRSDLIELDWSVEDAIKVVMSGGILAPPTINFDREKTWGDLQATVAQSLGADLPPHGAPAIAAAGKS